MRRIPGVAAHAEPERPAHATLSRSPRTTRGAKVLAPASQATRLRIKLDVSSESHDSSRTARSSGQGTGAGLRGRKHPLAAAVGQPMRLEARPPAKARGQVPADPC